MLRNLCLSFLLSAALSAQAAMELEIIGPISEATIQAGKKKSEVCQGCHGEDGISLNPKCPNLAGQFPAYLDKQIMDFQAGRRTDPIMTGMSTIVAEREDAKDIAAYFATRKRMSSKRGGNGEMAARGEKLFKEGNADTGLYGCANCHGENGMGKAVNNFVFPVIAGQSRDYIVKQLKKLHSGERRNDPAGMMGNIAKKMTDAEIEAVAEYLSGL